MLGAAEILSLYGIRGDLIVERLDRLSSHSRVELPKMWVDLAIDLQTVVVAEEGRNSLHKIRLTGRRVRVVSFLQGEEPQADAGGQECLKPVWLHSDFLGYRQSENLLA